MGGKNCEENVLSACQATPKAVPVTLVSDRWRIKSRVLKRRLRNYIDPTVLLKAAAFKHHNIRRGLTG